MTASHDTAALAGTDLPSITALEDSESWDASTVWPGDFIAGIQVRRRYFSVRVCPECAHEWTADSSAGGSEDAAGADIEVRDAVGNVLQGGDAVTITTTMKVKGAQQALKAGTKVRSIRLMPENWDHNISARVDGFGQMELKSSIVKKN